MKAHSRAQALRRAPVADLADRLRRHSCKVTEPRRTILEILRRRRHPLTNKEIFAAMPKGTCDLATVYRSMHLLEEMGMARRFDFGDGAARFELVTGAGDAH